jgi:hypothetical protein
MVKKLEQINNSQNIITKDLTVKEQKISQILSDSYNTKTIKELNSLTWITATPIASGSAQNMSAGHILPETVSFSQDFDFHIDSKFLPFIKTELLVKAVKNVNLCGVLPYIYEGFENDYVEIYGNGTELIYKGFPREVYYVYGQSDLDDGLFQEAYTKKVYRGVIEYTRGGSLYKVDGRVIRIEIINILGTGCSGGNYDYLECYIDPGYAGSENIAKFHDLLSGSVDITGVLYHFTFSSNPTPPPDCVQNYPVITVSPYRHTWVFGSSEVDDYRIKLKEASVYKWISGAWVFQTSGDWVVDTDTDTISSRDFIFQGYWLFYDDDTRYLFGIRNKTPLSYEGIYRRKELYNLPQDPYRTWNTIVFKRNYGIHPEIVPINATATSSKYQIITKLFKTTDTIKEKYRISVAGNFILSALANIKTVSQVPLYNDVYTQSGVTYIPTENHTLKDMNIYKTSKESVQYAIRLSLTNPYELTNRQNNEL